MKLKNYLDDLKKALEKITNAQKNGGSSNGKIGNLIIIALFMVLIGLSINIFLSSDTKETSIMNDPIVTGEKEEDFVDYGYTNETREYGQSVKKELKGFLESMEGVGEVSVMIHFESGQELVPAINENDSKSITDETDTSGGKRNISTDSNGNTVVMENKGDRSEALITKVNEPTISGVVINAEGASENLVKLRIEQAVMTLFNLKKEQVQVYPMK